MIRKPAPCHLFVRILVQALLLNLTFFAPTAQAAFVPEEKKTVTIKKDNPQNAADFYFVLASLSNRELEALTGKKLTFKEKLSLKALRQQVRKKNLLPVTFPPEQMQKCFTMYLVNGDVIEVKLIQITTNEIKYQRCNKPDDPEIIIAKEDVFSIKDSEGDTIYSSKNEKWKKGYEVTDGATDKLALAAGIAGIAAITVGLFFWPVGLLGALAAGIMAPMALSRFKKNPNLRGKGWAITGLVASILWTFFVILAILVIAAGW